MSSVEVDGLSLSYGTTPVLQDLQLSVPTGVVQAVLGQSGCGKTSLLRALAGLLRPTGGTIRIGDAEVFGPGMWVRPENRNVGIVPQEGALFPHLDVAGNVAFGLTGTASEKRARVAELLTVVGMEGTERMRPFELSGGMQQRVAVARALSRRPALVLLDEPFSALDAGLRDDVRADVITAIRADGATAVLVTHDQDEALGSADLVAVMRDGRIVQQGSPDEIYLQPADLATARFVGDVLELPATLIGIDATRGVLDVDAALGRLTALAGGSSALHAGSEGTLVVRPEDLVLVPPQEGDARCGTVVGVRYQGHDCLITIALDHGPTVTARSLGRSPAAAGQRTGVRVTRTPLFFPASAG